MANFCTNCGSKLEDYYNFCVNCGAKIDKSNTKPHNTSFNQYSDSSGNRSTEEEFKRVIGGSFFSINFIDALLDNNLDLATGEVIKLQVKKEIDSGQIKSGDIESRVNQLIQEFKTKNEQKNKLNTIEEIFESQEIKSEIRKNGIDQKTVLSIKNSLKNKLIDKQENMSEAEIRYYIKNELINVGKEIQKARMAKEMRSKEIVKNNAKRGGYCSLNCRHCNEEFLDSGGGIVGDFDSGGYYEYYCNLGHSVALGAFCKDFE